MLRLSLLSLCGSVMLLSSTAAADPQDSADARFNKTLEVQTAMVRARAFMREEMGQKAVEVLEEQLPKVNGNMEYLALLRDAYRAYVRDLYLAGHPEQAQRYLDRLCILDPSAARDSALRKQAPTAPRKFEPAPPQAKTVFPKFKLSNPFAKKEEPKTPPVVKTAVIRFQAEDVPLMDPFDRKNQREGAAQAGTRIPAQKLLALGAEAFKQQRYAQAESYFEQASQADPANLEVCRDQLAYCIIKGVTDQLDNSASLASRGKDLQQRVERALRLVPNNPKMLAKGQELLQQIDRRSRLPGTQAPQVFARSTKVKHWGENSEGWQVTETAHFRIFHRQNNEFAEQVAQIAERTYGTMYRKWFNKEGVEWQAACELILHPSASSYTQMTGVPSNSPGHSRIESDPSGRIIARRMDLRHDIHDMLEAVLPHEATHVVIAGMFNSPTVPRWVDEGIAVLSEPDHKIDLHRRNLLKNHEEGNLFGLRELMELKDYPQPRRIGAFYAQSVVLVEFLVGQRGPKVFTDFVRDGVRQGYATALQRHYQLTFAQLEQQWQQQILSNPERFAAKK